MGLILTRYEDSDNNNIVFDSSKFDYSLDGETFPTDVVTDVDDIFMEYGDCFNVETQTTTTDIQGNIVSVTETRFRVYGMIQDISKKDREIHEMGLAVPGNSKIFLKEKYGIVSGGVTTYYTPKEGDILIDRDHNKWRIIKIIGERYFENTMSFKVGVVQKIFLEGTS